MYFLFSQVCLLLRKLIMLIEGGKKLFNVNNRWKEKLPIILLFTDIYISNLMYILLFYIDVDIYICVYIHEELPRWH